MVMGTGGFDGPARHEQQVRQASQKCEAAFRSGPLDLLIMRATASDSNVLDGYEDKFGGDV